VEYNGRDRREEIREEGGGGRERRKRRKTSEFNMQKTNVVINKLDSKMYVS
jgi:hypothetical protein